MKKTSELLQSLLSSSIAKWSKENSPGLLKSATAVCILLGIVDSIVQAPVCYIITVLILLLFIITWGVRLYHWHRHQTLEEEKIKEEIQAAKNEEQRKQEKHRSELLQGEMTADAQREIAKQIVQTLMANPNISDVSIGNNQILGNNFQVKVSTQQEQGEAPSKIRQMNNR